MADVLMEAFPEIPEMSFETSKSAMKMERKRMALQLLEASGTFYTISIACS